MAFHFFLAHRLLFSFIKYPFMNELQDFPSAQLVNLLAEQTISYYKLIGDNASVEECTQCNDRIRQIEIELNSRRDPQERNILNRQYKLPTPEYSL